MSHNTFIRLNELEERYLLFFRSEATALVNYLIDQQLMSASQVTTVLTPIADFQGWLDQRIDDIRDALAGADGLMALTEVIGGMIEGMADQAERAAHAETGLTDNPLTSVLNGLSGLRRFSGQAELEYLSTILPDPALLQEIQENARAIQTEIQTLLDQQDQASQSRNQ